jgi:hypothetical protein
MPSAVDVAAIVALAKKEAEKAAGALRFEARDGGLWLNGAMLIDGAALRGRDGRDGIDGKNGALKSTCRPVIHTRAPRHDP